MHFDKKNLSNEQLVEIYRNLLLPRLVEEKMLLLLRQGKISKWFSGIGQEAISVGATMALQPDEWIMPLHRNLGVFLSRKIALNKLVQQWQGNVSGYSKGRERSFHFGSREHFICGMISHLGPQLAIGDGVALAYKLRQESKVSVAFTGEGGTSEGDFHEALNLAAVWDLPIIFIVENNGYALSTPVSEQYRCSRIADKARGYGMESVTIDGNNVLTVYDTVKGVREYCIREQKPYLIECMTFRMRGHEEASGVKYVPPQLFMDWELKDPIKTYENYLVEQQVLSRPEIEDTRTRFSAFIDDETHIGLQSNPVVCNPEAEIADVYCKQENPSDNANDYAQFMETAGSVPVAGTVTSEKRFIDAISDGLMAAMKKYENLVLMGQDIAEYGGAFKITEGLMDMFGKSRVRNTPLCESAILGASLGLSIEGFKSMVELQFADFISSGFNQVVNNLAKIHYRWGQSADVVIRMPTGAGVGGGPFHSQSNEAWFIHTPGLKVVYPSTPEDAKGLLLAAFNDPNPVIYFEHKALYRSIRGMVPEDDYETPIGKARHIRTGYDISIITYGMGVHWALEYVKNNPGSSIDILDLRTLLPLDYTAIRAAVTRTGKVLILHEDTLIGGLGAEISAWITEHCFHQLDAPVMRCASLDTPVPFNADLEKNFLANARLDEFVQRLISY